MKVCFPQRLTALILALLLAGCAKLEPQFSAVAGKMSEAYSLLSSTAVKNQVPVILNLWHGFTGREAQALEALAENFNATLGQENRIRLQLSGYDGLEGVSQAVFQAVQEEAEKTDDLARLPDLFFALDDTAYRFDQMNLAMHLDDFLTEAEQDAFLDSVKLEAFPGGKGAMTLFPVGIDTSVLLLNKSSWDEFCAAQGEEGTEPESWPYQDNTLATWEGVGQAAQAYQQWRAQSAAQEEESAAQGKPASFFAASSWAKLLISGYQGLGRQMFTVDERSVQFDFERERIRTFWDFWYAGCIQGFFALEECREAFSEGEAVACLLSTSEAQSITNKAVDASGRKTLVNIDILPAPKFSSGSPVTMQETLGLVAVKGRQEHQEAIKIFLRYLMEPQRMAQLAVSAGRLPALKKAVSNAVLEQAYSAQKLTGLEQMILSQAKKQLYTHVQLPLAVFDGGKDVVETMDAALDKSGEAARSLYETVTSSGIDPQQAFALMTGERQFERWYLSFRDNLVELALLRGAGRNAA